MTSLMTSFSTILSTGTSLMTSFSTTTVSVSPPPHAKAAVSIPTASATSPLDIQLDLRIPQTSFKAGLCPQGGPVPDHSTGCSVSSLSCKAASNPTI